MPPAWTDVVTALTAAGALVVAWVAWTTSVNTLRTSYRPVIRVVPVLDSATNQNDETRLILKNIGWGPALSVVLLQLHETAPQGHVSARIDVVEPLGGSPDGQETTRQGRVILHMLGNFRMEWARDYRLLYQDIAGSWHETAFTFGPVELKVVLRGPVRWWHARQASRRVPNHVRELAQVVRALESL
jgi:hypothetical protein